MTESGSKTMLIGDAGSTKTAWRLIKADGAIRQHLSEGFNPYYQTQEQLTLSMGNALSGFREEMPEVVHFYGAGCSTATQCLKVNNAIASIFPGAHIHVLHDLLAAARALCGHQPGIACILGTGSNSCLYDGAEIIDNVPNLGLWLGDEGSGGYIGRELVAAFLRNELPGPLSERFAKRYKLSREEALNKVYHQEFPNRWLATFSKFAFDNLKDAYVHALVKNALLPFFERNICRYQDYRSVKVHFVGSVAFYYQQVLREVAREKEVTIGKILEDPIAGLTLYHQQII